jgi:predicted metal-dependent hydrolase
LNPVPTPPEQQQGGDSEEIRLLADPRLAAAIGLFNRGQWYACHDGFEELWHETQGASRPLLQGLLQAAVAQLHLERGNLRGATVLMGEALGRLERCGEQGLGVELVPLRRTLRLWLEALQMGAPTQTLPLPHLQMAMQHPPVN